MLGALLNRIKTHHGPVNIAIDCSESTATAHVAYAAIIQSLLSSISDRSGVAIFFTDQIEKIIPINQLLEFGIYNMLKTIPPAGGDMAPVYGFLSVASSNDLLVVVTDGFISLPPQPHFPIVWALAGTPTYQEPYHVREDGWLFYGEHYHIGGEKLGITT